MNTKPPFSGGVPLMRNLDISYAAHPGPLAVPAVVPLPSSNGVTVLSFGGQSRVEAAALAILAGFAASNSQFPLEQDVMMTAINLAERFVAEIDRRKKEAT